MGRGKLPQARIYNAAVSTTSTTPTLVKWLQRAALPSGVRTIPRHAATAGTAQGAVREDNQDRVAIAAFSSAEPKEAFEFFAVCDGMGGLREGGQCAATAIAEMVSSLLRSRREFDRPSRLRTALESANRRIFDLYRERGGTTLAGVLLTRNGGTAVAVGDTRVYLHEGNGDVTQVTIDDTLGARIAGIHGEDSQAAHKSPFADHLAQFVGQRGSPQPQIIDLRSVFSDLGDHGPKGRPKGVLLVSDGVHRMARQTLEALVKTAGSGREIVARLLHLSEWLGGHDNASALYISAAVRASAERSGEDAHGLTLSDPFGDLNWPLGMPEELDDSPPQLASGNLGRYVGSRNQPGTQIGYRAHVYGIKAPQIGKPTRDLVATGEITPSEPHRVSGNRSIFYNRDTDSAGPAAQEVSTGALESDPQSSDSASPGAPREAASDRRATRASAKAKRKGKARNKVKGGKGKEKDEQPEFQILFSQEQDPD